jgi:hypothetical protein
MALILMEARILPYWLIRSILFITPPPEKKREGPAYPLSTLPWLPPALRLSQWFAHRIGTAGFVANSILLKFPCPNMDRYSNAPYKAPRSFFPMMRTVSLPAVLSQKPSSPSVLAASGTSPQAFW